MSYPRKLQILVVEDEQDPVDGYRDLFNVLRADFPLVEPVYARCFADAREKIASSSAFHLVILDLNLPIENRQPAADGLAPGEQLLGMLAQRDAYPVPVVLVVTGKLHLAQPASLQDRLATDFWHGKLVNKGLDYANYVKEGLAKAQAYCDVGIHIRDSGREWFPTLAPREEDLLRRCVLDQTHCLGVDLKWWGAETGPSVSRPTPTTGPTKVLMGHFILDDGMEPSIPTFFKFEPAGNAAFACRDVGILALKLGHIKVYHTSNSRHHSLIVTQSVTNHGWPVSFNEFLQRDFSAESDPIPTIVNDVIGQLQRLGNCSEDQVPASQFLYDFLSREMIEKTWREGDARNLVTDGALDPLATYDAVKATEYRPWASRRACIHGDLNATNIAIDTTDPNRPEAYIFDAAGMQPDLEYRDLATLEATTILFNSFGFDLQLIQTCRPFYEREFIPSSLAIPDETAPLIKNVIRLLTALRARVASEGKQQVYSLLMFNAVMQQMSGLGFQPSPNKIRNPMHACVLAAWVSRSLQHMVPEVFLAAGSVEGGIVGKGQIPAPT